MRPESQPGSIRPDRTRSIRSGRTRRTAAGPPRRPTVDQLRVAQSWGDRPLGRQRTPLRARAIRTGRSAHRRPLRPWRLRTIPATGTPSARDRYAKCAVAGRERRPRRPCRECLPGSGGGAAEVGGQCLAAPVGARSGHGSALGQLRQVRGGGPSLAGLRPYTRPMPAGRDGASGIVEGCRHLCPSARAGPLRVGAMTTRSSGRSAGA